MPSAWARETGQRLLETTSPLLLQRTVRRSPALTSACRLTALCLAAEVVTTDKRAAAVFSDVAAGLTSLQLRASGHGVATETILLARA